jgi:hypothetical protein
MRRKASDPARAAIILLLAVGLLTAGAPALAKSPKKGVYGAIAVNRDSKAVGYAYDFKASQDAKREALRQCGEKKCEVVVSFRGGCAAVARSGKRLATSTGATRDEAETKATRKCGKECAVLAWACTKQ